MKKLLLITISIILCISFCSCNQTAATNDRLTNIEAPNYNNVESSSLTSIMAAEGSTVFYRWDGFYNPRVSAFDGDNKKHLLNNGVQFPLETHCGDYYVFGDKAYFSTENMEENANSAVSDTISAISNYNFYQCDLKTKTNKKLFSLDSTTIFSWYVWGDSFAFKKFIYEDPNDSSSGKEAYSLSCYDLSEEKEYSVCDNIVSCIFVSGDLRYLTYDNGTFTLFKYDTETNESEILGDFRIEKYNSEAYEPIYLAYNYTDEKVIVSEYAERYDHIAVYDIASDTVNEYTLPASVNAIIAGEKYAYALFAPSGVYIYDGKELITPDGDENTDGVYKIDLSDGTYKKLNIPVNEDTNIFVQSDDELYIEQGRMVIILYKVSVYRYDFEEDRAIKLFEY